MIRARMTSRLAGLVATVFVVTWAATAVAAPSGPPIRIGGTLALTGPLAATALLHKIAVYVEELNRANGLLGRPVEWVVAAQEPGAHNRRSVPLRWPEQLRR